MERLTTTKILVQNPEGQFLVLRSSEWPENPNRSLQPDLPGGVAETGETLEVAIIRETKEETGIMLNNSRPELVYTCSEIHPSFTLNRFIFKAIISNNPSVILSWEHDKFWWLTFKEMTALKWRSPYPQVFEYLEKAGLIE